MRKLKVLFYLCLAVILLSAASPQPIVDSWAVAYVENATAQGFVPPAFTDLTRPITRAEFTDLAVRLYEYNAGEEIDGRLYFNDTSDPNVEKMGYLNIVSGVGDGYFNPDGLITREQAALIFVRLYYVMHVNHGVFVPVLFDLPQLPDVFVDYGQASAWAADGVVIAHALGIMGGVGGNRFDPQGDFTVQQSIAAMWRLFEIVPVHRPPAAADIVLNITAYTASGLTYYFENLSNASLMYGHMFTLYVWGDDGWGYVPSIIDDWAFVGKGISIHPRSTTEERVIDWTWMFGELPPGRYRFRKDVTFNRRPGDFTRFVLEREFIL